MSEGPEYSDCPDPDEFILLYHGFLQTHAYFLIFLLPGPATVLHG